MDNSLVGSLARALANYAEPTLNIGPLDFSAEAASPGPDYDGIAETLIREAFANGLERDIHFVTESKKPGEGSTAEYVAFTQPRVGFVLKIDSKPKLAEEAFVLRGMRLRRDIPDGFGNRFPRIYAIKADGPPYAYLMEKFENAKSLAELAFGAHPSKRLNRCVNDVLGVLLSAYEQSLNKLLTPNVGEIYLSRIDERLAKARKADRQFSTLSKHSVIVGKTKLEPPDNYLETIRNNIGFFAVSFSTFVHGDPNPENILFLCDKNGDPKDVRFIDMKEWNNGDYMFDLAKIAHYLEVTGPLRTLQSNERVTKKDRTAVYATYRLEVPAPIKLAMRSFRTKVEQLSKKLEDSNWEARYELAMASNLLGLVDGRIKMGKQNIAFVMYLEGLRHLKVCADIVKGKNK